MDIKITGVTFEILRDALAQAQRGAPVDPRARCTRRSPARARRSRRTRRGSSAIKIDPDKIGLLIGKGGETIRGLQDEFDAQIDVNDDGQVLVYSSNGEMGEALAERIRSMTKEVEVGDAFTGKVVKTTTFGAFVELAKGTDGLLHISNVVAGPAASTTVEDVLNKGDEIAVRVVEVDRERGRIGLRLAEDPDDRGQVRRGAGGGRLRRRRRAAATAATAATAAATATARRARPRAQRRRARLGPPASPLGRRPERADPRPPLAEATHRARP